MAIKDAYLAGILAHVPEAERGKAETAIAQLEDGGLRQSDYSRLAAEAQATKDRFDALHTANLDWFEEKKAALAETDTLRAKVADLEKRPAVADLPKDMVTEKALREQIAELERGAAGFISASTALSLQHYKEFGDVLDINALLADKRVQQIGIQGVYNDKFATQIKAKADAAQATRDEAIREEGRVAERTRLAATQTAYPVVGNEAATLDAIEAARAGKAPETKSIEQMSAEYARLGSTRSA